MNRVVSSPVIRKPSLVPLPRRRPTRLTPPLPPLLLHLLRAALVLLVLWSEHLSFRWAAAHSCAFDDSPSTRARVWDGTLASGTGAAAGWTADSRWRDAALRQDRRGTPFHVLVLADPQLLDLHSYPGRPWLLRWLSVRISDAYARKAWSVVTRLSRGSGGGGGGVDAVVWLGDLLDSGVQTVVNPAEYAAEVHRFHLLFPLPRATTSAFSALSAAAGRSSLVSSSSQLVPPIPSILVPGNHDLGLHRASASLAAYGRERFAEAFGPLWGVREWNGWELVWIDSMALLEPEFWDSDGGPYREMKRWLEELGQGPVTVPRILLSHIPLYRPEGTPCGRAREHSRPLAQGAGHNYQNELDARASRYLLRTVRPSLVYSGDDHDYCFVRHEGVTSPLDGITPVTETTVKAFSLAMGIRRPGYHLLSLYAPLPPAGTPTPPFSAEDESDEADVPVSYTYTQRNCVLPDALGTYLHLYLPLAGSFLLFFLAPKLAVVVRTAVSRRRHSRRSAVARANGSSWAGSSGGGGAHSGGGGGRQGGHQRSLSASLLEAARAVAAGGGGGAGGRSGASARAELDIDAEDVEAYYPGLMGGPAQLDDARLGNGGGSTVLIGGAEEDETEDELDDEDEIDGGFFLNGSGGRQNGTLPLAHHHRPGSSRRGHASPGGHVRRVSRVWLWEGGPESDEDRGSSGASLSTRRLRGDNGTSKTGARTSPLWVSRLAQLPASALDRLAHNSPIFRGVARPVYRAVRALWRKVAAPFARRRAGGRGGSRATAGAGVGAGGPVGQALAEAGQELMEVAWPAVLTWGLVLVWYML